MIADFETGLTNLMQHHPNYVIAFVVLLVACVVAICALVARTWEVTIETRPEHKTVNDPWAPENMPHPNFPHESHFPNQGENQQCPDTE